jgi:hypothetical protein
MRLFLVDCRGLVPRRNPGLENVTASRLGRVMRLFLVDGGGVIPRASLAGASG